MPIPISQGTQDQIRNATRQAQGLLTTLNALQANPQGRDMSEQEYRFLTSLVGAVSLLATGTSSLLASLQRVR